MGNFYITGDTHGQFKRIYNFCMENQTTRDDTLVILGDVGIHYTKNKKIYRRLKKELSELPITLFCIHGNHEERPYNYPYAHYKERKWHEAIVYMEDEYPNIIFAKDGEVYDFNGNKTLVVGGAYSIDKKYRIRMGYNWYESEQPSEEIKEYTEKTLSKYQWNVDTVFSHTCPYKYMPKHLFIPMIEQDTVDNSTEIWLGKLEEKLRYKEWYFGHFHDYYTVEKMTMLFNDVVIWHPEKCMYDKMTDLNIERE